VADAIRMPGQDEGKAAMKRTTFALAGALPAALLLAGCGDDLEARNERAMQERKDRTEAPDDAQEVEQDDTVTESANAPLGSDIAADDSASEPDSDEDSEETVVDASPEDLMDTTEGFAPEPLDDAAGLEPAPINPDPLPQ